MTDKYEHDQQAVANLRLHNPPRNARHFDQECYSLAEKFLSENEQDCSELRVELALLIQETIEEFIEANT